MPFLFLVTGSHAEVTLDGTLGPAGSLSGPDYQITADLGRQVGTNLFHSFDRFGLDTGESATFSGPDSVANVIGRVTGGEASSIDGTIRSTIPDADLYLTNPAGIMFGPNARLDVDGSFHAGTAHHLSLEDGGRFDAATPEASTLTAAPVAAFGFLDQTPAAVTVESGFLRVPEGERLTLVGGDVSITDATLYAPGGGIDVAAVGAGGEVSVGDGRFEVGGTGTGGAVEITHTAESLPVENGHTLGNLDVSGESGGVIRIHGGQIIVQSGYLFADTWGDGDAGGLQLEAQDKIQVQGGSWLTSDTLGTGNGGAIDITVKGGMEVADGGVIGSVTYAQGDAGTVSVTAGKLVVDGQGCGSYTGIYSDAESGSSGNAGAVIVTVDEAMEVVDGGTIGSGAFAAGDAGTVTVTAGQLLVDGQGSGLFTGIASQAEPGSSGDGGTVEITVEGGMEVVDGGTISSGTYAGGDAGTITVQAGRLLVDGQGSELATGITSQATSDSFGDAGAIDITVAEAMEIVNGGAISSSTFAEGDAGTVTVATGRLLVDRQGAQDITSISSQASSGSSGDAGAVDITVAGAMEVVDGGQIGSSTFGEGRAGTVTLEAGRLLVDGQGAQSATGISSQTVSGSHNGGIIDIRVEESMEIVDGGQIQSTSFAEGDAGTITVSAGELLVDGQGSTYASGIFSATTDAGSGGRIEVSAASIALRNGGAIGAFSSGSGNAGDITLVGNGSVRLDGGYILTESLQSSGGSITVSAPSTQVTDGGAITASVFGAESSDGGNVTVSGDNLVLLEGSRITATAAVGMGGRILVDTDVFLHDAESSGDVLDASSGTAGNDGTVEVNAPELDISGSLVALPGSFLDASGALGSSCNAVRAGRRSSLLLQVRDGVPAGPDGPVPRTNRGCSDHNVH